MRKSDIRRAQILQNVSKFINDFYALNDGGEFEQSFKEICAHEFSFKKESLNNSEGSIKIDNNQ